MYAYSSTCMAEWIRVENLCLQTFETLTSAGTTGEYVFKTISTNPDKIKRANYEVYELPTEEGSRQRLVRIQINRWRFIYESGLSTKRHDVEVFFHHSVNAFPGRFNQRDIVIKMFECLADTAKDVTTRLDGKSLCVLDVVAYIVGLYQALLKISVMLTKQMYYAEFVQLSTTYEMAINALQWSVRNTFISAINQQSATNQLSLLAENIKGLLGMVQKWNERESFYSGKSTKFEGIKKFSDFLPPLDDSRDCTICFNITLEETTDFGIMSKCKHVFCSPCLKRWFENNNTCPMCRSQSFWMSKKFYHYRQRQMCRH